MNKEKLKYLTIGFILSALMFTTISTIASTRVVIQTIWERANGRSIALAEPTIR